MIDATDRLGQSLDPGRMSGAELEARAKAARTISAISDSIYESPDYTSVVESSVDAFARFTQSSAVALYALEEGTRRLELLESRGFSSAISAAGLRLPLDGSISGVAIARRAVVTVDDVSAEPKVAEAVRRQLVEGGFGSGASVPLLRRDRGIGVINFFYKGEPRISEYEREMLLAIGRAIALALDSARHVIRVEAEVAERRRAEVKLAYLAAFSEDANATVSAPEALFALIARYGAGLVRDVCALLVLSDDAQWFEVGASCDLSDRPEHAFLASGARFPVEGSAAGDAVRTAATIFLPEADPVGHPGAYGGPAYSLICAPLVAHQRVVGVMQLARTSPGRPYTEDDKALIEGIAHCAGFAVENSLLLDAARKAARARETFLAILAHELKTPLTPLRLGMDSLARAARSGSDMPPGKCDSRIAVVERQVARLERLVDDLLEQAGRRFDLTRASVDLGSLVTEICEHLRPRSPGTGCPIDLRIHRDAVGRWDSARLAEAIGRVVGNALKYGAGRPVEVSVDAGGGFALLRVTDHGIGIDAHDQQRIFEPFERVAPERHYAGLGLGLWVARAIVEAHGGTLDVESRVGVGSTFTMRLPLQE